MSTRIRHGLVALVAVLLSATSIWWSASLASAGGPTSVIMVNPGTGQAAALHTGDPRYQELVDAVGAYRSPVGETTPPAAVAGCEPCEIRLTWLIHDVHVWRIDRVHLTDDGIWLASVSGEHSATDLSGQQPVWQRPHDPEALAGLLRALALTGPVSGDSAGDGSAGDEVTTAGSSATNPVGIALGTGAAGLLAGLAVGWVAHRRHTRGDGPQPQDPRQERVVLSG